MPGLSLIMLLAGGDGLPPALQTLADSFRYAGETRRQSDERIKYESGRAHRHAPSRAPAVLERACG